MLSEVSPLPLCSLFSRPCSSFLSATGYLDSLLISGTLIDMYLWEERRQQGAQQIPSEPPFSGGAGVMQTSPLQHSSLVIPAHRLAVEMRWNLARSMIHRPRPPPPAGGMIVWESDHLWSCGFCSTCVTLGGDSISPF